ncbi:MAG TPA: protein kinase [Woeseiaceae bacterium]|nr:protein kinase [Woeseiaceae bacterium]
MQSVTRQQRNRYIALTFASVLLFVIYGPLAQLFTGIDRFIYDRFAASLPNDPLEKGVIISIDPRRTNVASVLDRYGEIIAKLRAADVARIVLPNPPEIPESDPLPAWSADLAAGVPTYVPTQHRFAALARRSGFVDEKPDPDGVLRRAELWRLIKGDMRPALAVAIAFDRDDPDITRRLANADEAIYLSRYRALRRVDVDDLIFGRINSRSLTGMTVFVDAEPALESASALLPSGQYVTHSEITAALLADIEQDQAIISPTWIQALEWLAPILLAIVAVMFMPDRGRRDIAVMSLAVVVGLLLLEALSLYVMHIRFDLGRAILVFVGVAILSIWLVGDNRKELRHAFKRGADFLAAGRLEPAFAELRRCPPSETLAGIMYKLSLAFEQQAKPERAEAVLEWMKRTHSAMPVSTASGKPATGMPQRLGRYVIEKRIGRGAMGAVYLARDPRINRAVAVKAIPIAHEFEDEELKEARLRFYREAESAGRLTHPNIITVYDAGEEKGLAFIAMEYVPGIALKEFTDPVRLLAPKRALELCALTADALDYAHHQGVIHRDIKPANLLYNPKEGALKISDFGVARLTDNNKTKTGIVLGTPMYMSPEQLGAEPLTGLSDLFSLGVTLYELLCGEVPFKATNIAVLMTKITSEDPAPVASRRAGIPASVDAILSKALAKNPRDRFSCGAELAAALRSCTRN